MSDDLSMQTLQASSYLSGGNAGYLEGLYENYLKNSESVSLEWRQYFQSLPKVDGLPNLDISHAEIRNHFLELAKQPRQRNAVSGDVALERKQTQVNELVNAYRRFGHFAAKTNPLSDNTSLVPELTINYHGLNTADYASTFDVAPLFNRKTTLKEICEALEQTYCGSIASEYLHIRNTEEVQWLQQRLETRRATLKLSSEEKRELLKQLTAADGLEKYLQHRYLGQKRFSLEGGDSYVPLMRRIAERSANNAVKEIVIGMAHRGRLNTFINILGQSPEELFQGFEGKKDFGMTSGDVKYHLGFSSNIKTAAGPLHMSLLFNPSHLEIISAVAMGATRARQDRSNDTARKEALAIIVHGDAAISGQGIVMETLNMSQTRAYFIGGSIHVVINNQVGFTTSNPHDARSGQYCTDVAKMIDIPIFHVNGDDPEAVLFVADLAADYRARFQKDIMIDLVCYRRLGHNEADEPSATQPLMYQKIHQHPVPREVYAQRLIQENIITEQEANDLFMAYRNSLDAGRPVVETLPNEQVYKYASNWKPFIGQTWNSPVNTGVEKDKLIAIAKRLDNMPQGFELQRQVGNIVTARAKMTAGELPLDWGYAENLAYATLLAEGYHIRMSGQDCRRGTFAHRHAVLHDQKSDQEYVPLAHISDGQARFEIYDSLLSEAGVMGFEYGYASTVPNALVIWEAQFGDFANGAQVIIDQFISSGWQKWQILCGLTLLLPHGYEGSGPEHSSARLERYLQLCAQKNMQVCVPTTPAQIFHLLRRQVIRPYRNPLIVMTPKSLLRHKLAVSSLDDLASGKYQLVIPEIDEINASKVQRVVMCSGKVYYDLLAQRREQKKDHIAIIRIEQLYPFPYDELKAVLEQYKNAKEIIWCQEEPQNQGAWFISRHRFERCLLKGQRLDYAGREPSASPAAGYIALHAKQQAELIAKALA